MKRILFALTFCLVAALASAQARLGINIPSTNDVGRDLVATRAAQTGWWMVSIGAPAVPDDPSKTLNTTAFENYLTSLLQSHLNVMVRMGHRVNPTTAWTKFAGVSWTTPYYPPKQTWQKIAAYQSVILKSCLNACARANAPPSNVWVEVFNESGIGGVNGPCNGIWSIAGAHYTNYQGYWKQYLSTNDPTYYAKAKSEFLIAFPSYLWVNGSAMPEGYIPPALPELIRYIRYANSFGGMKTGYTFELANKTSAVQELTSFATPDGLRVIDACSKTRFNIYSDARKFTDPKTKKTRGATPDENATVFMSKINDRREWIRSCMVNGVAVYANEDLGITEWNIRDDRVPPGGDVSLYRLAIEKQFLSLIGIDVAIAFTALETDATTAHDGFYKLPNGVLVPVGSIEAAPINIGSH